MVNYIPKLIIHGLTDEGLVRDHNEDFISWDDEIGLVMLADGMGGHNAGEVASELAINSIHDALKEVLSPEVKNSCKLDLNEAVNEAVIYANEQINNHSVSHPECSGMGTTVVMALYHADSVILGSVGDSRIYRYRNGRLKQVTTDHSLVQEMIDNGYMTEEEAVNSSNRNLITRALGISESVVVDVTELKTKAKDVYLLCSDGLSDMISDKQILSALAKSRRNFERATGDLIELAKEHGGHDNVSVILVECK